MLSPEGPMSLSRIQLASLDLSHFRSYLLPKGWIEVEWEYGIYAVVFRCQRPGKRRHEAIVPVDHQVLSYVYLMNNAVIEIARCEGRKGWEVLEDLEVAKILST